MRCASAEELLLLTSEPENSGRFFLIEDIFDPAEQLQLPALKLTFSVGAARHPDLTVQAIEATLDEIEV